MTVLATFLRFGGLFMLNLFVSKCDHQIKTYTYHRSDVKKSGTAKVPSNVLSNKTLVECAVITSIASEMSFYFRERPIECIVEKEETNYLTDPFESEFIRFIALRKDPEMLGFEAMSDQYPKTTALTRGPLDDLFNLVPSDFLVPSLPGDGDISYPNAQEKEQSQAMTTQPTDRKKSLAGELLKKAKGLL